MSRRTFASVDEYIGAQPSAARAVLERVRRIIRKAVPAAREGISYGIPTCYLHDRVVLYFAGWKQHYSIYPITKRLAAAFADELASHDVRKSTIRFSFSDPIPVQLIGRLATFRAKEVAERPRS
ncbi:MAG: iron chaperone [Vicinamibacterales bacterium]